MLTTRIVWVRSAGACRRRGLATLLAKTSALVTGGAAGLGQAICQRLAKDGYAVTIADVNGDAGQALAQEIGGAFVLADVSDPEQVQAAVAAVTNNHGTLDALVNNAGIVGPQVPFGDYEVEDWKRILSVNLDGTFYGLKYGLKQMAQQETGGSIVNMSSTAGFRGITRLAPYVASKFAVRGMTQAAAVEYAHKRIRVNCIAPTTAETDMVKEFIASSEHPPEAVQDLVTAMNAIPGFVQPSDVAAACAFLLSKEARYITGHTIPVDAGALCRIANARELFPAD